MREPPLVLYFFWECSATADSTLTHEHQGILTAPCSSALPQELLKLTSRSPRVTPNLLASVLLKQKETPEPCGSKGLWKCHPVTSECLQNSCDALLSAHVTIWPLIIYRDPLIVPYIWPFIAYICTYHFSPGKWGIMYWLLYWWLLSPVCIVLVVIIVATWFGGRESNLRITIHILLLNMVTLYFNVKFSLLTVNYNVCLNILPILVLINY